MTHRHMHMQAGELVGLVLLKPYMDYDASLEIPNSGNWHDALLDLCFRLGFGTRHGLNDCPYIHTCICTYLHTHACTRWYFTM